MRELKPTYKIDLNNAIDGTVHISRLFHSRILITGITGLIGGFIVDMLLHANATLDADIEIYGLARNEAKANERFAYTDSKKLHLIIQGVCEPIELFKPVDYIIHAAGDGYPEAFRVRPVETMTPALLGTINTLELAKKNDVKSYLYISSGEVYGNSIKLEPHQEREEISAAGMSTRSCYPVSKQAAEILTASYAAEYNVNAKVVRPSHTFGAYVTAADNRASTQFLRLAAAHEDIILHSKGQQVRSYTYVVDTAAAILTVLINGENGEAYNIANPESTVSIADFAKETARIAGVQCRFELPDEAQSKEATPISFSVLDATKLLNLGWRGRYNITEGIEQTLENLR